MDSYEHPVSTKVIFIVEDDEAIRKVVQEIIAEEFACQIVTFLSGREALHSFQDLKPDLLIVNYNLPHMTGIEFYDQVHMREASPIPTIMISARLPYKQLEERGIVALEKPFEMDQLLQIVREKLDL